MRLMKSNCIALVLNCRLLTLVSQYGTQFGLSHVSSVLFNAPAFSENIFLNTANCLLHLETEGNFVRWVLYFGIKYGRVFCDEVNRRVISSSKSARFLLDLPHGIYKFDCKNGRAIDVKKYSGRELDGCVRLYLVCIEDLVPIEDLVCFFNYLNYYFSLNERNWPSAKIDLLSDAIYSWKLGMIRCFDPTEVTDSGELKYSFSYPNFDSVDAWPFLIRRFGPPVYYSTTYWEAVHPHLRALKTAGNEKNIEKNMLALDGKILFNRLSDLNTGMDVEPSAYNVKENFHFTGKSKLENLDSVTKGYLRQFYSQNSIPIADGSFSSSIRPFRGIWLDGHIHRIGSYFKLLSAGTSYICLLKKIFSHEIGETVRKVLKVKYYHLDQNRLGILTYSEGRTTYLLLLPDTQISFDVHVLPSFTNANCCLLNTWANLS